MRMTSITLLRTQVKLQERLGGDCGTCFWAVSICVLPRVGGPAMR